MYKRQGNGNASGSNGGTTTFNPAGTGTTITANGGGGGQGISTDHSTLSGLMGNGGSTSGGEINIIGHCGSGSEINTAIGGTIHLSSNTGGGSFWGGHNQVQYSTSGKVNANGASVYGAGGNSGVCKSSSGNASGGSGGSGYVVIMEYA